jgi:DNA-binding YbaB/EbfC family protein
MVRRKSGGNMQQPSMKMMNQLQNRMMKIQQELEETIVEGTSGGGVVKAQVTGQREFKSIKIDPSAVDPEDVEMLEDLIAAAVQDAMEKAQAMAEEKMSAITGGIKIPGLT